MGKKNDLLKDELYNKGYTYETFISDLDKFNNNTIKYRSALSKRINGKVLFTQIEIENICKLLNKTPIELFFTYWLHVEEQCDCKVSETEIHV